MSRSVHLTLLERRAFGDLLDVIDDPALQDILIHVDGDRGVMWLDRGSGLQLHSEHPFRDPPAIRDLAVRLIVAGGRHVDDLNPYADVRLGDGIRVHAVLAPIVPAGAAISIRLPNPARPSLGDLITGGLCDEETANVLRYVLAHRLNLLVTGATASGKTTLLAALLDEVPEDERIITIEDVAELRLRHPHHVSLEARQPNSEGAGAVSLESLLRETLRMRPDRIVLGECRGTEVVTLLSALNTGHSGGAGTLHANSIYDVPARLEALGSLAGLAPAATARQAASALQCLVHLTREHGQHRVDMIAALDLDRRGSLVVTPIENRQ